MAVKKFRWSQAELGNSCVCERKRVLEIRQYYSLSLSDTWALSFLNVVSLVI